MIGWLRAQTRSTLAVVWGLFVFFWIVSAFIAMGFSRLVACGGISEDPPPGRYCEAFHDYLKSGEPGEVTTALVYVWPVALLLGLGLHGVLRRRASFLFIVASAASAAVLLHVFLSVVAG